MGDPQNQSLQLTLSPPAIGHALAMEPQPRQDAGPGLTTGLSVSRLKHSYAAPSGR
jgi:hypothetical protein